MNDYVLCCSIYINVLMYMFTSTLETKVDGAYTRMLRDALNKSWRDYVTNKLLYGNIPRIKDTIREQRLRFSGHCWRNRSEVYRVKYYSGIHNTDNALEDSL